MTETRLSVPMSKDQAFALVDAVMDHDGVALSATAREENDNAWVFEAICDSKPDLDAFTALARDILGGTLDFEIEEIDPETDWVGQSLAGLAPVSAGGFYVHGSHETGPVPVGPTAIMIDAAQAFGTGHHETTTGCLEAIDMVLKRTRPRVMLDVGTGTGVLAIALAKRTRHPVVASDIDPVATTIAAQNARHNDVGNLVLTITAPGLSDNAIVGNGPYQLIVANILAGPLKALAPDIGRVAQSGARIILSGILHHQAARVIAAYAKAGMVLERQIRRGDWSILILRRAAAPKRKTCC